MMTTTVLPPGAISVNPASPGFEWMTLYDPTTRPVAHLMLEVVIVGCAIAGLVHALRARQRGDLTPLFTWTTIFVYGLAMELLSYQFVRNFTHAQFTVMFYGRQLPLYVIAIYPAMLYTGIVTARRLGLRPALAGFAAGLLIVAVDMPFDILGPVVGWWSWSDKDPNIAYRWLDVPATSYYWHLCFGGILAALTQVIGPRVRTLPRLFAFVLPVGVLTIVLGLVSFVPFHALSALGVSHGVIVAGALVGSLLVTVLARRHVDHAPDRLILGIAATFYAFHMIVAFQLAPANKLVVILAVTAFAAAMNVLVHRERIARESRAPAR